MGEVYRAHDEELDRDVALKVLSAAASDENARDRLLREARLASALNHPNICTIYQISADGLHPFIAMEYVSGPTLTALTHDGPLSAERALRYGLQIADALEHAHGQGVIHRDLKSSNVMVAGGDRIKVLDFGLAKRTKARELDSATLSGVSLTESGAIVGTLQYMAPEILRGAVASPASEVWAFGIVMYEMLAGAIPFRGESTYELTTSIMRDPTPLLPVGVPPALRTVVERCLQKPPGERYASAGELRAALQSVASGKSVAIPPLPKPQPWRLRAVLFATAALAAIFLSWGTWRLLHSPTSSTQSVAILPFANGGSDPDTEYLSDGLTENLIDVASRLPDIRVISRTSAFHYRGKEVDPQKVGKELNVQTVLVGRITIRNSQLDLDTELINTADQSRMWGSHYTRPISESAGLKQDLARDLSQQLLGSGHGGTATITPETKNNDAYQDSLRGQYHMDKYTPEEFEIAKKYYEKAISEDPTYAPAYSGLSDYYNLLADEGIAPPRDALLKGKAAAEKVLQLDPHSARSAATLASFKGTYDWNFQAAEQDFRKLLAEYPSSDSMVYDLYAICLRTLGRGDESIAAMRKAVQLDPLSVSTSTELGWALYYFRHYDQAAAQFRDTLVLQPDYVAAHFGLALALNQKGSQPEAAAEFERFLEISAGKQVADDFHRTYQRSGYAAALRGMWTLQLQNLQESAKHGYVSPILFADTYALLGDKENAFIWLEKAYQERSTKMLDLKVDPDYDLLRSDPRFAQLTKKIGLP